MSERPCCRCPLCRIERNLLARFSDSREQELYRAFVSSTRSLSTFPDVPALLAHLRASQGDPRTDDIFRDLLEAGAAPPGLVEAFFVLAFVPVIHRTLRQVTALQPSLPLEDATQEALRSLLQVLRSDEFRVRQTHIAFAIARAVKRSLFAWAKREGMVVAVDQQISEDAFLVSEEELFEQHAVLRHFCIVVFRRVCSPTTSSTFSFNSSSTAIAARTSAIRRASPPMRSASAQSVCWLNFGVSPKHRLIPGNKMKNSANCQARTQEKLSIFQIERHVFLFQN